MEKISHFVRIRPCEPRFVTKVVACKREEVEVDGSTGPPWCSLPAAVVVVVGVVVAWQVPVRERKSVEIVLVRVV